MTVLVTGAAGFIGFHTAAALLARGETVIGLDNLNPYYDVRLKRARVERLAGRSGFRFVELDVSEPEPLAGLLEANPEITGIVHLAAQAGVRYSLENPYSYVQANVTGQVAVFEAARRLPRLEHLVYASSSSVYGASRRLPFATDDPVDRPISLYAASKRAAELIAHTYGHLYGIPATGLRFFTVYGPWGRPDMAAYLFADAIAHGRPIRVFSHGRMQRAFTFIEDIVAGVLAALDRPPPADDYGVRHRLYNLGNDCSEDLLTFIEVLEQAFGRKAALRYEPMQPGDVPATEADIAPARRDLGFAPRTPIRVGLPAFVAWYRDYHGL